MRYPLFVLCWVVGPGRRSGMDDGGSWLGKVFVPLWWVAGWGRQWHMAWTMAAAKGKTYHASLPWFQYVGGSLLAVGALAVVIAVVVTEHDFLHIILSSGAP